jgi:hypothetical protein
MVFRFNKPKSVIQVVMKHTKPNNMTIVGTRVGVSYEDPGGSRHIHHTFAPSFLRTKLEGTRGEA